MPRLPNRSPRSLQPFAANHRKDSVDALLNGAVVIGGSQARLDDRAGDVSRLRVGQNALESVADFDAHLSVAGEEEEDGSVVLPLLADTPLMHRLVAELFDRRIRREAAIDIDEDLVRRIALE